jgi:hypothetical protein
MRYFGIGSRSIGQLFGRSTHLIRNWTDDAHHARDRAAMRRRYHGGGAPTKLIKAAGC